jgi:hypothetical protein
MKEKVTKDSYKSQPTVKEMQKTYRIEHKDKVEKRVGNKKKPK